MIRPMASHVSALSSIVAKGHQAMHFVSPPAHRAVRKAAPQGCAKVRPVEGSSCSAALKSEDRRPKPERRPKSEFREWPDSIGGCSAGVAINSAFGLRVSGLEWPGPTLEQPWLPLGICF